MASKYILDTCALIYYLEDKPQIGSLIESLIRRHEVYYSTVNLWEMAIKIKKGFLEAPPIDEEFIQALNQSMEGGIPVSDEHIVTLYQLKNLSTHKDPFDRLIISQAITEKAVVITSDRQFSQYEEIEMFDLGTVGK